MSCGKRSIQHPLVGWHLSPESMYWSGRCHAAASKIINKKEHVRYKGPSVFTAVNLMPNKKEHARYKGSSVFVAVINIMPLDPLLYQFERHYAIRLLLFDAIILKKKKQSSCRSYHTIHNTHRYYSCLRTTKYWLDAGAHLKEGVRNARHVVLRRKPRAQ